MKVFVMDSKLRKHCVDVHDAASVAHVKRLLADLSLLPAGLVPKLVYQQLMLGDDECIGGIVYSLERSVSLVCVRSTPASAAAGPELHSVSSLSTGPNPTAAARQAPASAYADVAAPSAQSAPAPPPVIDFATEWVDEDGRVCPKSVDYATQCPKGHALAPLFCSGDPQPQQTSDADVICRVCHGLTQRQHARDWLQCSVAACCGGYAVCAACVIELGSARGAAAASADDFCMLVMLLACELKQRVFAKCAAVAVLSSLFSH